MTDNASVDYIPGTCNLGLDETKRRTRNGYIGLSVAFLVLILLEILDTPRMYRLFVLPPVFYSISGFLQARHRFCYLYGFYGVFSVSGRKQFKKVKEDEALKKDRRTAWKIVGMSTIGAIVITGIYLLL